MLVAECVYERFLASRRPFIELLGKCLVSVKLGNGLSKAKSIVPQGIELNNISCTWHHGISVGGGVHPCHGLVPTVAVQQSVVS